MKKTIITILGFVLMLTGFTALILSLVGVRLTLLSFIDSLGSPGSFVAKLVMINVGFVLIYIGKSNEV